MKDLHIKIEDHLHLEISQAIMKIYTETGEKPTLKKFILDAVEEKINNILNPSRN